MSVATIVITTTRAGAASSVIINRGGGTLNEITSATGSDGTGDIDLLNLDVSGLLNVTGITQQAVYTVANLPAASAQGKRAFVSDSTNGLSNHHNHIVAGGGSNFTPVFSDGTNWRIG
jgi:hypothetical protein